MWMIDPEIQLQLANTAHQERMDLAALRRTMKPERPERCLARLRRMVDRPVVRA